MALTCRVIHTTVLSRHKRISLNALLIMLQFPRGAGAWCCPWRPTALRSVLHADMTPTTQLANRAGTWSSTIHIQNRESIRDIHFFGHFPTGHHHSEGCILYFDMYVIKALVQNGERRHVSALLNQGPAVFPPPPQRICLGCYLEIQPNKPHTPPDE